MKNAPYWTAVLVGVLVVIVIFIMVKRKEKLEALSIEEAQQAADMEKFVGTLTLDNYYEGDKSTIPYKDKVYIYLSSFSGTQSDHATSVYSGSGVPMWRSLVNEDVYFNVIGTDLPSTLANGLPMKGTRLVGPPSENAAYPNTAYVLPSFTIAFYAKWKTLDFDTDAPIILFRMFAENPNHVQVSLKEVDSNNVSLDVVVGNASSVYSWTIPKTTLLTQGTGTLYTFVYNKEEKKISFNIGSTIKYPRVLTDAAVVKLGNTPMDINFNQNWDADLKSFMFFRDAITDFSTLDSYMVDQASGKNMIASSVDQQTAALQETLKACSLNDEELAGLRDELNLTREQLYNIRLKLRQCSQKPEDIAPNAFRRWQIKDGLYPGQYDNLNQCKDLNVKNVDEIKSNLASVLINMFASPLKKAVTGGSTSSSSTFPPTLYTTFPNKGFKTQTTDPKSTYLPTPYPDQAATAPTPVSTAPWKLKELVTKFGQTEPIQQATQIATAQLLPTASSTTSSTSATSSTASSSTASATQIPDATVLPRPQVSDVGVKLVYGDPTKTDQVTGAQFTTSIASPTTTGTVTTTVNPSTTSTTISGTSTQNVATSSLLSVLTSLFSSK